MRTSRSQCTGPRLKTETRPCRGTQCRRKHARHTPLWTTGNWQTVNIDKKYIFYSKNFTFAYLFLDLHALVFFASSVFCGAFLYLVSKNEKRSEMASLRHTVVFSVLYRLIQIKIVQCSKSCGNGLQRREVSCKYRRCSRRKPPSIQRCNSHR